MPKGSKRLILRDWPKHSEMARPKDYRMHWLKDWPRPTVKGLPMANTTARPRHLETHWLTGSKMH